MEQLSKEESYDLARVIILFHAYGHLELRDADDNPVICEDAQGHELIFCRRCGGHICWRCMEAGLLDIDECPEFAYEPQRDSP